MASAPDGSPPSPTTPSPPKSKEKDAPPPSPSSPTSKESGSPPPESSSKTPEKSPPPKKKSSPPPPSPSPPPPASSPPPPSSTPTPPASPPPSTPKPSQPSSSTPPAPTNNQGNNQNSVPAATTTHAPKPPHLTPRITPTTPQNASTHSPPPPRLHSSPSKNDSGSKSNSSISSQTLPIILGLSAGVVVLLIVILTIIIIACCRRKEKSEHDKHIHFHNYTTSAGDDGHAQAGHSANTHVINVVSPTGGNVGHGGWPQTPLTPQTLGHTSYSSDMSANIHGQVLPPLPAYATPLGINQISFTYEELSRATNGFSQANLLGQGGFGYVYKGVLPSGKEVAVKSLKSGSGQGEREFQAEVETISRVHHRHLVSLVGYSISGDERMLAYEFLPNNTLEFHLHEQDPLDWHTRLKIALGAAKGLAYLHEDCHPRIIHRDIKSANILLDFTFEAKVADFGLARLTQDNNTHVSTRVMGTFGYLAPEYALSGKLTDKSDVFSFGVVLLELITGRRPLDLKTNDESLVDWARPLCAIAAENGNFSALVDPRLENNFDHQEMTRMVACAAASIRHSARRRPKMRQVVRALEGDIPLDEINGPTAASQTSRFSMINDTSENELGSYSYTADMEKFRKLVMESQEY